MGVITIITIKTNKNKNYKLNTWLIFGGSDVFENLIFLIFGDIKIFKKKKKRFCWHLPLLI